VAVVMWLGTDEIYTWKCNRGVGCTLVNASAYRPYTPIQRIGAYERPYTLASVSLVIYY